MASQKTQREMRRHFRKKTSMDGRHKAGHDDGGVDRVKQTTDWVRLVPSAPIR
jgi:hypothetical protein